MLSIVNFWNQTRSRIKSIFPPGGSLPEEIWVRRYRFLLGLTWLHALVIALIGPALGYRWDATIEALFTDGYVLHTVFEGLIIGLLAAIGSFRWGGRTLKASAVALGLMTSSATLVHLSGGYIELHFHFFVMLTFLALLQDWVPYTLAILYVALHHGLVGIIAPDEVYNHAAAINAPWTWAGIHAFFVLWSCVGSIIAWRFNEKALEQIKKQALELEEANRLQSDFTAMIAHDLRSPLSTVLNTAALMEQGIFGEVNDEQRKWLSKTQHSCETMIDIISDFLDISKIEAGRLDLVKEKIDLYRLIHGTLESYSPVAKLKNISLKNSAIHEVPEIQADGRRLEQVLSNLISNAIKFTPAGGNIEVGARPADSTVRLWVSDTGEGIAPEEIPELFQKYRQTRSGKISEHKSTGLGLVICKMIAEAHGGKISVESRVGSGSTFYVDIPQRSISVQN